MMRYVTTFADNDGDAAAVAHVGRASMLEDGAGLSAQNLLNLRTILSGRTDFESVKSALLQMDTKHKSLLGKFHRVLRTPVSP